MQDSIQQNQRQTGSLCRQRWCRVDHAQPSNERKHEKNAVETRITVDEQRRDLIIIIRDYVSREEARREYYISTATRPTTVLHLIK